MGSTHQPLDRKALISMVLLAIQFGVQPFLTRRYTPQGITRSTVVLAQEVVKFVIAYFMLSASGGTQKALKGWSVSTWTSVALTPAILYSVQNVAALTAYQNLDALTFNVLNQTKTLSAALCCYFVMGRPQSRMQVFSLFLLLLSALIMEGVLPLEWILNVKDIKVQHDASWDARHWTLGVMPVLLASFLSGLAGALSQMNLQSAGGGRNAYLFSMELCAGSILVLGLSLFVTSDGQQLREKGFFNGWNTYTLIPIVTNSIGGILVGLVIKYAGTVRKGFALIFGILLSGIVQAVVSDEPITYSQMAGGVLAALSMYLHSVSPPIPTASKRKKA